MNDLEAGVPRYGDGEACFRAAGDEAGLRPLVDRLYDLIEERPDAARIRQLARALPSGKWIGGN